MKEFARKMQIARKGLCFRRSEDFPECKILKNRNRSLVNAIFDETQKCLWKVCSQAHAEYRFTCPLTEFTLLQRIIYSFNFL